MPRLPTIRVTGSHAISVSSRPSVADVSWRLVLVMASSPVALVPGQQLRALLAPFGLLVHGLHREVAQRTDDRAVHGARRRRHPGPRWFVHERHELVRKTRHGAGDADAADVRA